MPLQRVRAGRLYQSVYEPSRLNHPPLPGSPSERRNRFTPRGANGSTRACAWPRCRGRRLIAGSIRSRISGVRVMGLRALRYSLSLNHCGAMVCLPAMGWPPRLERCLPFPLACRASFHRGHLVCQVGTKSRLAVQRTHRSELIWNSCERALLDRGSKPWQHIRIEEQIFWRSFSCAFL